MKKLEELINRKIDEGAFASHEQAVATIQRWIEQMETKFVDESMRNEDA